MSPQDYTEDELVEQPAIQLFAELGWQTVSAIEEEFGEIPSPDFFPEPGVGICLGRESRAEVVLIPRLRAALSKLNPTLLSEALDAAVEEIARDRSAMSLVAANREIYALLKDGVQVSAPDRERGGQKTERVRILDWESPQANDFLLVSQITFIGSLYTCRPDLVGFVNGLPLIVIELKKPGLAAKQAFDGNLTSYKHAQNGVPALFRFNALLIASNGADSRVGSLTADWERFFEWKRVEREDEPRRVSLEVMLRGTCEPSRLLDLIENFTLFSEQKAGLVKVIGQNHQFLGVNNAIAAMLEARATGRGQGGVFWQTQGSGKSFSMIFFAQKVLRRLPGNWTFVVVTDRVELDEQIAKTFAACGAVSDAKACHATSGDHLEELLRGNERYVFTLIHKFQSTERLCDRRDVIVLVDEAHRSQYDTLALNMRGALPNALFIAFTGTPLIAGEERTREVFGDYVSVYDFQQSAEDGATVPLFYENRTPELHLENPGLNDDIYTLIDEAGLSEEAEKKLEQQLGRQYQILTRDDRLETIAKDIVSHFLGRGFQGKAMVISIDKATALRMHDKVRKYWTAELTRAQDELAGFRQDSADPDTRRLEELRQRVQILRTTDMALIVSPGQNEIEQMAGRGLDIVPHRKRMNNEALDEKFKDPDDPLRLVFVCAMWLTGFDAPSCSTVYLDKPMRNHTLMQTIARANRVYGAKKCGLIVDYCNVFASLEKALAIYGTGKGGETPVRDKQALVEELRQAVGEADAFCTAHGVSLKAIEEATGFGPAMKIKDAVDALIAPDEVRKAFLCAQRLVQTLYNAVKPDPAVITFRGTNACLATIANAIRERTGEGEAPDITAVMTRVNTLLDESIAAANFSIADTQAGAPRRIDLSQIDFQALAKRFAGAKHKNLELEALKAAIRTYMDKLIRLNPSRTDYRERFEELIESYNAGSRNIDELFAALLRLTRELNEEETRHVRENLSPAELVIFDILTRPAPQLSPDERDEVKKVARQLLGRIEKLRVVNWQQKRQSCAAMRLAIGDTLDEGLPRVYTPQLFEQKVMALYEHAFQG